MELKFRWAQHEDIKIVSNLVNSAYRGESSKKGWTTEAELLGGQRTDAKDLEAFLNSENKKILLATTEAQMNLAEELNFNNASECFVGSCQIEFSPEAKSLYFGMFTVNPLLQNKGIGKEFLKYVENLAIGLGYQKIEMTVITLRNELIDYYIRRGFMRTERYIDFPEDPKFGLAKVPNLKMVYLEKKLL